MLSTKCKLLTSLRVDSSFFKKRYLLKCSVEQSLGIDKIFSAVALFSWEILCFKLGFVFCICDETRHQADTCECSECNM